MAEGQPIKTSWFEKHLNWSIVLSVLLCIIIIFIRQGSNNVGMIILNLAAGIFMLFVFGWSLNKKGRSLAWILTFIIPIIGIIVLLALENKRLTNHTATKENTN